MRAAEDAAGVAERLSALGFEAVLAPVLAPAALDATVPSGPFSAAIATSAKALTLASDAMIASLRGLPLYVVGLAGLRAAEARGLREKGVTPDAAQLATALIAILPRRARALYLAAADRKADLEDALRAAGIVVETVVVYEARAVEAWSEKEAAALANVDAALHYSRRSAEIASRLAARAGLGERWPAIAHVAISRDAAAPLQAAGASVFIAAAPDEAAMFEALSAALN